MRKRLLSKELQDQHAFVPSGSTTTALINLIHEITQIIRNGDYAIVIALDFSKAFDTIRHYNLLQKYSKLHINDAIYNWIVDFFKDHNHQTTYNGETSTTKYINSSVVQGSVLGPISYVVTALDLKPLKESNKMLKYADDTYIIMKGKDYNERENDINNVKKWVVENNLNLNVSKSKEIIFKSNRCTKLLPPCLNGIERVKTLKILGVTLSDKLDMSKHINNILSTNVACLQRIRNIKAHGASQDIISYVYSALILSRMLYASQAWWGFARKQDFQRLEKFIKRSQKWGYYSSNVLELSETSRNMDMRLFQAIQSDTYHKLAHLLPPPADHRHNTRFRGYMIEAADNISMENFITRMTINHLYRH